MTELNTFKIEQKFNDTEDLYSYLLKNVDLIGELIGIQIQKPLKERIFCLTGKEKITERNILFFASQSEFPKNLGELILLAATFDADIVVFFFSNTNKTYLEPLIWLQKICNDDVAVVVGNAIF